MEYSNLKYLFKINLLLNSMILKIKEIFDFDKLEILFLKLDGMKIKKISQKTNKNEEEIKKILNEVLYKKKNLKTIKKNIKTLINLIENSFTFNERYIKNIPPNLFK
jgi:K+/H+ antiporter YhaU regulatory subunit KhtT